MTNPAIEIAALDAVATAVAYANITGNPAMSVPLWWNADGPSGSISSAATGTKRLAGQLETARPWSGRRPPHSVAEVIRSG